MAIKKSEIYSQIWAACDKLRGGVEPARYKDYILTLLFVKYVSDRFKSSDNWDIEVPEGGSFDDIAALKYKKNIGEGINIIIGKLAEANDLKGIIDIADFNSEELGTDKEAVDREGDLIIADTAEDSTVGKCVELVNVHGKVLSGQHTMLCRPKIAFAPKFLGYYMNAECFHNQMLPFITGIKVSSISKANISTLALKYPTLVEEQQAIAQVFSDMDNEIAQLEKKLSKYQQIKQGMMQKLLTGRIRLVDADRKEQPKTQILQERQPAHNQHFDDAVMIAGIVNAFYSEKYPLGRKKVQKLLYLVRRKEQADISAFHKKAAGPYADEVRYKGGEPIAQKNKYIQVKRNEKGSRFEKGVQMQQALTYLQDWGKQGDVDWLVSQFQYTSVNELELLATVDMAICDLRREGKEISVASIKDLIRSNKEWRDKLKKTYFRDSDIQRAIKKCEDLFES